MNKLIESLCLYCQGDFSDRMVTSFFVTHEDKSVRKTSETQREKLKEKAQKLHINLLLKTSIIIPKIQSLHKGESNDLMDKGWN